MSVENTQRNPNFSELTNCPFADGIQPIKISSPNVTRVTTSIDVTTPTINNIYMVTYLLHIVNTDNQELPEEEKLPTGIGICMGIIIGFGLGILTGIALGNLVLGVVLGVGVGIIFGYIIERKFSTKMFTLSGRGKIVTGSVIIVCAVLILIFFKYYFVLIAVYVTILLLSPLILYLLSKWD